MKEKPFDRVSRLGRMLASVAIAVIVGVGVTLVGVNVYSALARANLRYGSGVPWSLIPALIFLWGYWQFLGGRWWPRKLSPIREHLRRAHPIPGEARAAVALACATGVAFVLAMMTFALRLTALPADAFRILGDTAPPPRTTLPLLIMLAVYAGVAEEVGLRGYLQGAAEGITDARVAILLSALVFTLLHANKLWFFPQAVPMLIAGVWYGWLTVITRSIYPMIAVHISLDLALFGWFEVARRSPPAPLAQTGLPLIVWAHLAAAIGLGLGTLVLTSRLATRARPQPPFVR